MFLRHANSRRAVVQFRPNLFASLGVRAFSSGLRCTEASQQDPDTQPLIRRVIDTRRNPVKSRSGNTSSTHQGRKDDIREDNTREDDTLRDYEYRRWIKYPSEPSRFSTLCGLSLRPYDFKQIEAKLPEDLARDPLKPFTDNPEALDYKHARDCMQLYLYRLMESTTGRDRLSGHFLDQTYDLSAFRARLMKDHAGEKALSWLLNPARFKGVETIFDVKFIQATAFCLVGEGVSDVWWDMLKMQHTLTSTKTFTALGRDNSQMRWYSAWFTSIMEAQAFWTTEQNRLNEPLATFHEVVRLNWTERSNETKIPITAAVRWFLAKLPYYDTRHINVEDWDSFYQTALRYLGTEQLTSRFQFAVLKLKHPTRPSADPLLNILRRVKSDEEAMQQLASMDRGGFDLTVRNLVQFCYSTGSMTDVKRIIKFYHSLQRQRNTLDSPDAGEMKRKATRDEIARDEIFDQLLNGGNPDAGEIKRKATPDEIARDEQILNAEHRREQWKVRRQPA